MGQNLDGFNAPEGWFRDVVDRMPLRHRPLGGDRATLVFCSRYGALGRGAKGLPGLGKSRPGAPTRQSLNPDIRACFTQSLGLSVYQGRMLLRIAFFSSLLRAASAAAVLAFGVGLSGCADMGDTLSTAFADPAKYELYDCKQLETERKTLATRSAELQGLMAKADTGLAGPVVAELAYRNEYVSVRGQAKFAEEAWQRNKCHPSPPAAPAAAAPEPSPTPPAPGKGARRSGAAVH